MILEGDEEALCKQLLRYINWKTSDTDSYNFFDDLFTISGTVDIVGLHLIAHVLKQYYFETCHLLTLDIVFSNQVSLFVDQQNAINNANADVNTNAVQNDNADVVDDTRGDESDEEVIEMKLNEAEKNVEEAIMIVKHLCSIISHMPNLQSLHLTFQKFPHLCHLACLQMFDANPLKNTDANEKSVSVSHAQNAKKNNININDNEEVKTDSENANEMKNVDTIPDNAAENANAILPNNKALTELLLITPGMEDNINLNQFSLFPSLQQIFLAPSMFAAEQTFTANAQTIAHGHEHHHHDHHDIGHQHSNERRNGDDYDVNDNNNDVIMNAAAMTAGGEYNHDNSMLNNNGNMNIDTEDINVQKMLFNQFSANTNANANQQSDNFIKSISEFTDAEAENKDDAKEDDDVNVGDNNDSRPDMLMFDVKLSSEHRWQCRICTLFNPLHYSMCTACGTLKNQDWSMQQSFVSSQTGINHNNNNQHGHSHYSSSHHKQEAFESYSDGSLLEPAFVVFDETEESNDLLALESLEDDQKFECFHYCKFLETHPLLTSINIQINDGGTRGVNIMNGILLSLSKRQQSLSTCFIECQSLHLHYCVKYIVQLLKQHSFEKFGCIFESVDERSVCKILHTMANKPHLSLDFFSIIGNGSEHATHSIKLLNEFLASHSDLQYLNISYFEGIARQEAYYCNEWMKLCRFSLCRLKGLQFISLGKLLMDNNFIVNELCQFIHHSTTLQSIDLSISPQSYEGMGGALENTKKLVFYSVNRNQVYLKSQVDEADGCLEVQWRIPLHIIAIILEFTFNMRGQFNVNIQGMPEAHIFQVGQQFMKLKKAVTKKCKFDRDVQLFSRL